MTRPRSWRRRKQRESILILGDAADLGAWKRHNYARKLLAMIQTGEIPRVTGHVVIAHAPDCPALSGGYCDCDPEITAGDWPSGANN